jgi:hypothetical protein
VFDHTSNCDNSLDLFFCQSYMHNNPYQPHWDLAERPEDYIWSSARFYLLEQPAIIPLYNANLTLHKSEVSESREIKVTR